MMDEMSLMEIVRMFDTVGTPASVEPMGEGLINDTFRVRTAETDAPDYVLQRVNHAIFKDVAGLQRNIERVTEHIRRKLLAQGCKDVERRVLRLVGVRGEDRTFVEAEGGFWRMTVLIDGARTISEVTPETARLTGEAIGEFEAMLADLPGGPLVESIPRFHDMGFRLEELREAVAADRAGRLEGVRDLVEAFEGRAEEMLWAEREHAAGRLPKRVCHCDTKVSNVLFDADGGVLCVIDLDTLMPSFVSSDYGDFLRTAGSTAPEDEPDRSRIGVRWDVVDAFRQGYLSRAVFLTDVERGLLDRAMGMFAYMQGVRFLTDYLNGDVYYKTGYEDHNLVRARAQWRLLEAVEEGRP